MPDSRLSRRRWSALSARVKFSNRLPGLSWACSTACSTTTRRLSAIAKAASSRWLRNMPPLSSMPGNDSVSVSTSTALSSGSLSRACLPLDKASVSGCKCLADLVDSRVQSQRNAELALVKQDGRRFVYGVAAAVEFVAFVIKRLFVQLAQAVP